MMGQPHNKVSLGALRELNRMTQGDVANRIGIPVSDLQAYEQDSGQAPCGVIVKLCRLYRLPTAEMIL